MEKDIGLCILAYLEEDRSNGDGGGDVCYLGPTGCVP